MSPYLLLLLPALVLLVPALIELAVCVRRWRRRRRLSALTHGCIGGCLVVIVVLTGLLAASIAQYQKLGRDEFVARLVLRELEPQRFAVRLETAAGDHRSLELHGDQWQLDARVLRWRLPALLAGAPNLYRLERLSGRYRDVRQEREGVRSVHDLAGDGYLDLWTLRQQFPRWLGFVDTEFGSGVYMPMFDEARYEVALGPRGGMVVRAADAETSERLQRGW